MAHDVNSDAVTLAKDFIMLVRARFALWSRRVVGVVLVACVACAGSSTSIEQAWRAPDFRSNTLRSVVTLYVSHDGSIRRTVEDKMARKLAQLGVRAVPAYSLLTSAEVADHQLARSKLLAGELDGVVAIRLVGKEPGPNTTLDEYWGAAWPLLYDENYTFDAVVVRVETNVYAVRDNKLLWSALSRTVDPSSTRVVIDEVTTLMASELGKQAIVIVRR